MGEVRVPLVGISVVDATSTWDGFGRIVWGMRFPEFSGPNVVFDSWDERLLDVLLSSIVQSLVGAVDRQCWVAPRSECLSGLGDP